MNISESRKVNMTITSPGGNASKNAKGFRINIPSVWAKDMGITQDDKSVVMSYTDDKKLIIEKLIEK